MLKRLLCGMLSLCFLFLLPLTASAAEAAVGEILFAQRYADFTDARRTGIRIGTGGGVPAVSTDGALRIDVLDDQKTYLLLPDVPDGASWPDTYTVEFSFRFADIAAPNGYFGFLMTAAGDAPINRTELILRASGEIDDVGKLNEAITAAVASGAQVDVTVPVLHGMMYEVKVSAGGESQTLTLPTVRTIGEGRRGFVLRNASADVISVLVINGIDYDKKLGKYASASYMPP